MHPRLRFPEFTSPQQTKRLGDITKWSSGGTPSKNNAQYWGGEIPWISASSMYGKYFELSDRTLTNEGVKNGSRIAKQGSILLLVRGSMLFNTIPVGIASRDVAFNQDVKAITSDQIVLPYLYYFLKASEHDILSQVVSTGIGAGKLEMEQLRAIKIPVPQKDEQVKIANFLTAVDESIVRIDKKIKLLQQYRNGVVQKIFTQQIRFKDENEENYPDWKQVTLEQLLTLRTARNTSNDVSEVFSVAKSAGVINQVEHLGRSYAATDLSNYKVVEPGDIVYTKSPTSSFPFGIIKQNKLQRRGVVSVLYGIYKPNDYNTGYLLNVYFDSWQNTFNYLNPIVQKGAKNTINISDKNFLKGKQLLFPVNNKEKQKIVNYLSLLDTRLNIEKSELSAIKKFKEALLQRMFFTT